MATIDEISKELKKQSDIQKSAIGKVLDTAISQRNTELSQVPEQFVGDRNAVYLQQAQALNSMPESLSNMGYGADSGLSYSIGRDINTAFARNLDSVNTSQRNAQQAVRNSITDLQNQKTSKMAEIESGYQGAVANARQELYKAEQDRAAKEYAARQQAEADKAKYTYEAQQNQQNQQKQREALLKTAVDGIGNYAFEYQPVYDEKTDTTQFRRVLNIDKAKEAINGYVQNYGITPQEAQQLAAAIGVYDYTPGVKTQQTTSSSKSTGSYPDVSSLAKTYLDQTGAGRYDRRSNSIFVAADRVDEVRNAIANDYSAGKITRQQLEALAQELGL